MMKETEQVFFTTQVKSKNDSFVEIVFFSFFFQTSQFIKENGVNQNVTDRERCVTQMEHNTMVSGEMIKNMDLVNIKTINILTVENLKEI